MQNSNEDAICKFRQCIFRTFPKEHDGAWVHGHEEEDRVPLVACDTPEVEEWNGLADTLAQLPPMSLLLLLPQLRMKCWPIPRLRTCDADVVLVGIDIHAIAFDDEDAYAASMTSWKDGAAFSTQHLLNVDP